MSLSFVLKLARDFTDVPIPYIDVKLEYFAAIFVTTVLPL